MCVPGSVQMLGLWSLSIFSWRGLVSWEQGTHRELLAAKGPYYRLYTRQYEDEATKGILQ